MNSYFYILIVAVGVKLCSSEPPNGIGCGVNKTCFFQPNGCWKSTGKFDGTSCVVGATVVDSGDGNATVEVMAFIGEMDGVDISYYGIFVAFGLSYDKWMGDDSVMSCVWSPHVNTQPRLILNFNTGTEHGGDYTHGYAFDQTSGSTDSMFWCRFKRNIVAHGSNAPYIFPLNEPYYYLITRGVADATSQTPKIHSLSDSINFPFISYDKFTPIQANGGYSDATGDHGWASKVSRKMQFHLVYAHGGLMMLGFWVFLGTGIIFGRYYKIFYPENPKIAKKAGWFQVHRTVNVTGVLLIVISFICIFVSTGHLVGKDVGQTYQHMVLGVTAVILIVLLPIGAIFRPHPGAPYRPLFKDFHFFFAFTALALSFGSFVLAASDMSKGGLTKDPHSLKLMYSVVGILGFINILQTINMRVYQARKQISVSETIPEKVTPCKKPDYCGWSAMLLHIMTLIYVISTFSIAVYLIKVMADTGVKTLGEKFPCPCVS